MPLYWSPLIVSATTWPWTSIASAPLIVTMSSLAPITSGELTISTGRNATSWLPSSHSYSSGEPNANVVTLTPSYCPLRELVTLPARCSFMQPSVNISLCSP